MSGQQELHVISEFDGGGPYHNTHADDTLLGADGWFPYEDIRAETNTNVALTDTACATNQNGDLHICALDNSRKLLHTIRLADGTWPFPFGDVQSQTSQNGGTILDFAFLGPTTTLGLYPPTRCATR